MISSIVRCSLLIIVVIVASRPLLIIVVIVVIIITIRITTAAADHAVPAAAIVVIPTAHIGIAVVITIAWGRLWVMICVQKWIVDAEYCNECSLLEYACPLILHAKIFVVD